MSSLPKLEALAHFSGNAVTRILGFNPSPFTLQGTNTYLIRLSPKRLVLLDAAEGRDEYAPLLKEVLASEPAALTDIILSHFHHDHIQGLPSVLKALQEIGRPVPAVWKWPQKSEEEDSRTKAVWRNATKIEPTFTLRALEAGQTFSDGLDLSLEVFYTPGHSTDSIALRLNPQNAIFTTDSILGHGTAVFQNLKDYLHTLHTLRDLSDEHTRFYPAHGEIVENGRSKAQEYIDHRLVRVHQVLSILSQHGQSGLSAFEITKEIYADTIPQSVYPGAVRGILLILEKLQHDEHAALEGQNDPVVVPFFSSESVEALAHIRWKITALGTAQATKQFSKETPV